MMGGIGCPGAQVPVLAPCGVRPARPPWLTPWRPPAHIKCHSNTLEYFGQSFSLHVRLVCVKLLRGVANGWAVAARYLHRNYHQRARVISLVYTHTHIHTHVCIDTVHVWACACISPNFNPSGAHSRLLSFRGMCIRTA